MGHHRSSLFVKIIYYVDSKAEQPPISRPAVRTEPREHPSYSAVTSAEKFAVILSGYPKVLLSTKELSAVQEAILDVIRTQRQGAVKPFFTGCTFRPGWLLISCANRETADWLKARKASRRPHAQFITEDLVAVWAKVPTVCGEQEAVIASASIPGESNDAPPREILCTGAEHQNMFYVNAQNSAGVGYKYWEAGTKDLMLVAVRKRVINIT
ncbi:hypothetical protein ACLKA7_012259 [Drosophila subpalustris]